MGKYRSAVISASEDISAFCFPNRYSFTDTEFEASVIFSSPSKEDSVILCKTMSTC